MVIFFVKLFKPVAIRVGLVDLPGGRKQHEGTVPLIGGLAMFLGFAFSALFGSLFLRAWIGHTCE